MCNLFKKKSQTIIVKQEIDYDKLADAIVKAQKKLKEDEDKENNKLVMTKSLFCVIPVIVLILLAIFSLFILIASICLAFYNYKGITDEFGVYLALAFISLIIFVISVGTAYEIYNLKDLNKIITISSSVTSVVAAVIALATLIVTMR